MNIKNKFIISVITFSCVAITGTGVFASGQATQSSVPLMPEVKTDFQGEGSNLRSLLRKIPFRNLNLTPDQKRHFQELWTAFRLAQKQMLEKMASAQSLQEKESLRIERDQKKLDFHSQLLAFVPDHQKNQLQKLLSSKKGDDEQKKNPDSSSPFSDENNYGFLWSFLDESQLTAEQKAEITLLEQKKQLAMQEIMQKMAQGEKVEKSELYQQIEQVNTTFLTSLKNYIPEQKLSEYLDFIREIQDWNSKVKTKPVQSAPVLAQ